MERTKSACAINYLIALSGKRIHNRSKRSTAANSARLFVGQIALLFLLRASADAPDSSL